MPLDAIVIARSVATWRSRSRWVALSSPGLLRFARNDESGSSNPSMSLVTEIGAAHRIVGAQRLRGAAERHPAGFDQHRAVGEIKRERGVLLNDQEAHAL